MMQEFRRISHGCKISLSVKSIGEERLNSLLLDVVILVNCLKTFALTLTQENFTDISLIYYLICALKETRAH